jgi:sigma-B regulation protein RsbU (phosphoserine phosphatase)
VIHTPQTVPPPGTRASDQELLTTLFDLAHEVTSVLDQNELFRKIQELLSRVIPYDALAVYLLDEAREELRIAHHAGYPPGVAEMVRLRMGDGLVGAAVAQKQALLVRDVSNDRRYRGFVPGTRSALVVPLMLQTRVIGALNILSQHEDAFAERDVPLLKQFAAFVAVALENARTFELERRNAEIFETLGEVGREIASILDPDQLLTRLAQLVKRVIDYRTLGVMLLNEREAMLELKVAVEYGEFSCRPRIPLGEGLVGYAALHKEVVKVDDVTKDPRYVEIEGATNVRSELVVPLLYKDRCVGVFDLASPELAAFTTRDVQILTALANQTAVAIENARLYNEVAANEARLEKEVRFAQRVQLALLPQELPKRLKGVDLWARFEAARELGGDFHDFLLPEANLLVVAVGDVSGKGVPAALYSAFAGELLRGRTFRRRYTSIRSTPAGVLASMNTILHERQLEEYYCTLCYASFELKRKTVTIANSGLPYPIRRSADSCAQLDLPGVPLGSFAGTTYDEITLPLASGDLFVVCSDGIFEATNERGEEFTATRLIDVVERSRGKDARQTVDAIFDAVRAFRGFALQNDDMTAVAVRIL